MSRDIADRLFSQISFGSLRIFHCYISLEHFGEVETGIVFSGVWQMHPSIITTAPRVDDQRRDIDSMIYRHDTPTLESSWSIPEPAGSEIVPSQALDLVIVPLLCFDRRGHRVGYGRGFYDRLLQKCRPDCIKAGLSFFPPVNSIDDITEADIPLDVCVTPGETFRFPPSI